MIVILEGPDGGGKTTLAKHLEKEHGFKYVHTGPPGSGDVLEAYGRTLYDAAREPESVVIDRLQVGERIYGPILRGTDRLGRAGETLLRRLTNAYGARVVFCLPPYEVAFENWRKRHQENKELVTKAETYTKIYHAYRNLDQDIFYAQDTWWNYTVMEVELAAKLLLNFNDPRLRLPKGVIGSRYPQYLFVGEQANQEYLDLPFFALNGSSAYLNGCIADAGYKEPEIALVNSQALDGTRMPLDAIHLTIGEPKVIALGTHAHGALDTLRVKHVTIPHPSYWKRFHAAQRNVYVKQLREIRTGALRHHG